MSEKKNFVTSDDVDTQVFDWGRLSWLSEPLVTAAERFSCGVVTLEPGKGHVRQQIPHSACSPVLGAYDEDRRARQPAPRPAPRS